MIKDHPWQAVSEFELHQAAIDFDPVARRRRLADLGHLTARWQSEALRDISQAKAEELAKLDELERASITEALEYSQGQMGKAAASLGLTERIMALRMKKYGITYKAFRPVFRKGDEE